MKTVAQAPPKPAKEKKVSTCAEVAEALLKWQKLTTKKERLEIAEHTEEARKRMNNERLY
jgi:hypothetical protein